MWSLKQTAQRAEETQGQLTLPLLAVSLMYSLSSFRSDRLAEGKALRLPEWIVLDDL
jgi:uncharacterized membrane protein YwzB